MRPGDVVLLRSVYRGRVRWTFPHRLVEDDGARVALYCGPGAQGKWMRPDLGGAYIERWVRGDDPHLVAKLYAAGAIAVIRGSLLAGCLPSASTPNPTLKENV